MRVTGQGSRVWLIAIPILWAVPLTGQDFTISTIAGGVPPPTPAVATTVSIRPEYIAADTAGNVYFSSATLCVFKLDTAGILTLVAGNCRPGYSGDGGPAISARLNGSIGIALDGPGNLYIADSLNHRIRRVSSGIITTIGGTGEQGFSGDAGAAMSARLNSPSGVAVDATGNLYIADTGNHCIRRISTTGVITTVAGTGGGGYSGDGGPAVSARLSRPGGVAVDGAGNVYIADTGNNCIRRISTSGIISTVTSGMANPQGVAIDSAGNLLIADTNNHRVYRSADLPVIVTVAGTGDKGFSGDGGPATSAHLNRVSGVAADAAGNIYIADSFNRRVRRISPSGIISTVAGDGTDNHSGDGGPATSAQIGYPYGVAVDGAGSLYISDYSNHRVRRVSLSGTITTVAGSGVGGYSGDSGPATSAQLTAPFGVAVDRAGNLYIADSDAACIRSVSPSGVISTVAGTGVEGFSGDEGPAISALLDSPSYVALDNAGNLYVTDSGNNRVRRISPSGIITTVAGNGTRGYSGDGGPATSARLSSPQGVAVDEPGNVCFADSGNNRVRCVSPAGVISTVAGNGEGGFSGDGGPATSAAVSPYAVALDNAGNLYIADYFRNRIRRVSPHGVAVPGTIATLAGDGAGQYSGDGGPAASAQVAVPTDLAVDSAGRVYVTTWTAVRVLSPTCAASASPTALTAPALGGTLTLTIEAVASCGWTVTGLPYWITASAISGSGPAIVTLTVAANTDAARSANITAAGTAVTINQNANRRLRRTRS
jgi:trimeric autotransporter adhesin